LLKLFPCTVIACFCLLLLVGCAAPASAPAPSPAPTPTPRFTLSEPSEAELVRGAGVGEWNVVGLARPDVAIEDPHVLIVLRDSRGSEIARRTIEIPADPLPAGAAWPFRELFRPATTPGSAKATLLGAPAAGAPSPGAAGRVLRTFSNEQGSVVALGRLTFSGPGGGRLEALRLLGRDSSGRPTDVIEAEPATDDFASGVDAAFLAVLPAGSEDLTWEVYPIVRSADERHVPIRFSGIEFRQDDQGNPFVTAFVHNDSREPETLTLTALVLAADEWLGGASSSIPLPLAPGERLPLAIRLPRASLGDQGNGELQWRLFSRAKPAAGTPIPLPLEVIAYEPVSSTLILRIRLSGVEGGPVEHPSGFAWITGDDGRLVSAGWAAGPPSLAPGEDSVVTVTIPIPAGIDLEEGQIEVRAAGLPSPDPGP
jgi:hypothetical protein